MHWWKMLGAAVFTVIAAVGVAIARHRWRGSPEEIRARRHARFEEAARAARARAALTAQRP